jgi:two-component system phosphate regulon sensor histidine kinase PhoR
MTDRAILHPRTPSGEGDPGTSGSKGDATGPASAPARSPGLPTVGQAEAALDALLDGTGSDFLLLADRRLRVARAGAMAAELATRGIDELRGMSLIAAFGSIALDALAREALEADETRTGEVQLGRLGSRTYLVDAMPLATTGLLLFLHDVTGIRRVERVRRDFIANISHELRTPLSSIKLIAETLSSGAVEDPGTARDFAEQIEREVDHLRQLVDELLELSMIESGEVQLGLEPTAPEEVVAGVLERMTPLAERRRVSLRALEPPTHARFLVSADPARLGQALVNLVHNAIKFSHAGGEVRVGWEVLPGRIRFLISDDGLGIPAGHLPRIFERFYKVDRSRARDIEPGADDLRTGSAGLGLAIVRHIAEAHRGSVGVESHERVGSTFWIELPQAA